MIRHIVFFRFKPDANETDINGAIEGLRALPAKIDAIKKFEVGKNILPSNRAWDAALIGEYQDLTALDAYSKHEAHQEMVAKLGPLCESIGSVDYEV